MTDAMEFSELVDRFDDRLRTDDYVDVDASANGLQIGPDEVPGGVESVAFAVDAAAATAREAADRDADALVVHHGLSWGGFDRLTGRTYDRIEPLVANGIPLYVSHLPLDGHQDLGNAAGVADLFDLRDREPFGSLGGEHIGQRGRAPEPLSADEIRADLDGLDTGGRSPRVLDFGPEEIRDVAIVTGSGADWLGEAEAVGADALITGEGKQQVYHEAREAGVTVFLGGHYATETFGVRALASLAAEWGLETTFVDHPTGL